MMGGMRLGIADHLGWAVAVTASADHEVADRRRIELVEPGITAAPIHYESHRLDVAATAALVAKARASVARQILPELAHARAWEVHLYDAKAVEAQAVRLLAERADEVLRGPRATMGPPWAKDHRIALAATIMSATHHASSGSGTVAWPDVA
jgi:hypothetical protein